MCKKPTVYAVGFLHWRQPFSRLMTLAEKR